MSNVNTSKEDIAEEKSAAASVVPAAETVAQDQAVKTTPVRRPLRATMSLTNFEDQTQSQDGYQAHRSSHYIRRSGTTVATPEEFVTKFGGKRVINKILIANNGIAGNFVF